MPVNTDDNNPYGKDYTQFIQANRNDKTQKKQKTDDNSKQLDAIDLKKQQTRQSSQTDAETVKQEGNKPSATKEASQGTVQNREKSSIQKAPKGEPKTGADITQGSPKLAKPDNSKAAAKEILTGQAQPRPGDAPSEKMVKQLADAFQQYVPKDGEDVGKSLQKIVGQMLSQGPKDETGATDKNQEKQAYETVNDQQRSMQSDTTGLYMKNVRKMCKGAGGEQKNPEVNEETLKTAIQRPEFNKTFKSASPENFKQMNHIKEAAKKTTDPDINRTGKSPTATRHEGQTAQVASFYSQVEKQPTEKQGLFGRMFAGEVQKNQVSPNDRQTFDNIMKTADKAKTDASKTLEKLTGKGVDFDLESVKAAFKDDAAAKTFLESKLPGEDIDETMKQFEKYQKNHKSMQHVSPEKFRAFQEANSEFGLKAQDPKGETASKLAHTLKDEFKEGVKQYLSDSGLDANKELKKAVEDALKPGSDFFNSEKLKKEEGQLIQKLIDNGGMAAINDVPRKYAQRKGKLSKAVNFLTSIAAKLPQGKFAELKAKVESGEMSPKEMEREALKELGKKGNELLKQIGEKAGMLPGEELKIDEGSLKEVLGAMNHPRMKMKYQAAIFTQEIVNAGEELISEYFAPKAKQGEGSGTTTAQDDGSSSSSGASYKAPTEFEFQCTMAAFGNTMNMMMTEAQISNIQAQGESTRAKQIANECANQKAFRAQQDAQNQDPTKMQQIFGGIKEVFQVILGTALVAFGAGLTAMCPPLGLALTGIGGAMAVGATKGLATGNYDQNMMQSFAEGLELVPGIDESQAQFISSIVMPIFMAGAVIALTVISIILAIPSGGSSLFVMAIGYAAIAGSILMAVSSLLMIADQGLNEMNDSGVVTIDNIEAVNKWLSGIAMIIGAVGFVLCLPALLESIPKIFRAIGEFGSKAWTSLGEFGGKLMGNVARATSDANAVVDSAVIVSEITASSDDVVRLLDDAAALSGVADSADDIASVAGSAVDATGDVVGSTQSAVDELADVKQEISKVQEQLDDITRLEQELSDARSAEAVASPPEGGAPTEAAPEGTPPTDTAPEGSAPTETTTTTAGALADDPTIAKAEQLIQEGNFDEAEELLKELREMKTKKLEDLTEEALQLEIEIATEPPRNTELYNQQKETMDEALKGKDWVKKQEAWDAMDPQSQNTYYREATADPDIKKGTLDDLNKLKASKYDELKTKFKSDYDLQKLRGLFTKSKNAADFSLKLYNFLNTLVECSAKKQQLESQMDVDILMAEVRRLEQYIDSLDAATQLQEAIEEQGAKDIGIVAKKEQQMLTGQFIALSKLFNVDVTGIKPTAGVA